LEPDTIYLQAANRGIVDVANHKKEKEIKKIEIKRTQSQSQYDMNEAICSEIRLPVVRGDAGVNVE
jgi:hypothetical protein